MQDRTETGSKYLTFRLAEEEYGVAILKIREIIGMMQITGVPKAPAYIRGVVNLRGKIIPVIDLRRKFGLPDAPSKKENCIVTTVLESENKTGELLIGILVDSVNEVLQVADGDIEPLPALDEIRMPFVVGLAKSQDRVRILLNIDRVVREDVGGALQDLRDVSALASQA